MSAKPTKTGTRDAHFVVPGDPNTLTGGFIYDRLMATELRARGWNIAVTGLEGRFPDIDGIAMRSMQECFAAFSDGSVVIVDGLALGAFPELAAHHARRLTLIGLVHHPLGDETGLQNKQQRFYHAREIAALVETQGIIVTSDFTARRLCRLGLSMNCIRVAFPGASPAPLASGGGGNGRHLLCVATVTPRKRHDILLQALGCLKEADWTLTCVGDIERTAWSRKVLEILNETDLSDRVTFTGTVSESELSAVYDKADLFVLASEYEGFGMVFTEALARGLPVVGTTGGAVAETVPGNAGVLVPPGDVEAMREALSALLDDTSYFDQVKSGAVAARENLKDWASAGKVFDCHLRELVAT